MRKSKRRLRFIQSNALKSSMSVFFVIALALTAFQILWSNEECIHRTNAGIIALPQINSDLSYTLCDIMYLHVSVTKEGKLFVNLDDIPLNDKGEVERDPIDGIWKIDLNSPYKRRNKGDREVSLESLRELAKTLQQSSKRINILFFADKAAPYDKIEKVLEPLKAAGFNSIYLRGHL